MPTIVLPDKTELVFPEGMSDSDMQSEIEKEYPQFKAKPAETVPKPSPSHEPYKASMADVGISGGEFEDVQTVELPPFGKPGTLTRGVSSALTGAVQFGTSTEGVALAPTMMIPVAGPAIGTALSAAALWQAGKKGVEAIQTGSKEAAGEALATGALGVLGALGGAKGLRESIKALPKSTREAVKTVAEPSPETKPAPAAPQFKYKALNEKGVEVKGTIDASNQNEAFARLRQANLFPIRLIEVEIKPPTPSTGAAPETQAPTAATVSKAESGEVAASPKLPAISQSTTEAQPGQVPAKASAQTEPSVVETPSAGTAVPEPKAPSAQVEAGGAETGPGIVGMGAATPDELSSGAGADVYGVAERVRAERAKAGQVAEVSPGKGIAAADSVEHGRELLQSGADPEKALSDFEQTKRLSSDDMAVTRAHGERLAKAAREAEDTFGTDTPEYQAAKQRLSDWDARTKVMQTEWHKTGQAQQGETDIDTGSFTGLQRAYRQQTGKDFTPEQATTAKKKAATVKKADQEQTAAKKNLSDHVRKTSDTTQATEKALRTAQKVVIDWDVKKAQLETRKRVADAQRAKEIAQIEQEREAKVKSATDRATVRAVNEAARKAKREAETRAKLAKEAADIELKREKRVADAANELIRANAIKLARRSAKERELKADLPAYAWKKAREYIESGIEDFDEIRNKIATDMGLPVEKVTEALGRDKKAKFLMDEAWRKQQVARQVKQQARQWLMDTTVPGYIRALRSIPRIMFSLKVGFHGTVAMGTHAPMLAFQPPFWATYVRDFGKMYRLVGGLTPKGQANARAYYESQVQDLMRRPNYITARRAGLVNDPFQYEDYNSPDTTKYFGRMTTMGNRGYTVLKILRQDMFDQQWNQLPRTLKYPEMAQALADGINHATGVVKGRAPPGTNLALFAPRLEGSRVMWLAGDPFRAGRTFLEWNKASSAEKAFAINQIKEKAWVIGTLSSLLALNQGVLSATGSRQKVNFTDPFKSDFLKFKAAGMNFSYGNAMVTMARLPVQLYRIRSGPGGKARNIVFPDEDTYTVLGKYARSQESPFASLVTALWLKGDFQNRPLPSSERPVPARLRAQGIKPYTWTEFWSEQFLPIPAEEAAREVWKSGLGMSEEQIQQQLKALATISIMAATGGRLTEDVPYSGAKPVTR